MIGKESGRKGERGKDRKEDEIVTRHWIGFKKNGLNLNRECGRAEQSRAEQIPFGLTHSPFHCSLCLSRSLCNVCLSDCLCIEEWRSKLINCIQWVGRDICNGKELLDVKQRGIVGMMEQVQTHVRVHSVMWDAISGTTYNAMQCTAIITHYEIERCGLCAGVVWLQVVLRRRPRLCGL